MLVVAGAVDVECVVVVAGCAVGVVGGVVVVECAVVVVVCVVAVVCV